MRFETQKYLLIKKYQCVKQTFLNIYSKKNIFVNHQQQRCNVLNY